MTVKRRRVRNIKATQSTIRRKKNDKKQRNKERKKERMRERKKK